MLINSGGNIYLGIIKNGRNNKICDHRKGTKIKRMKMNDKIANSCLIVFNAYKEIDFERALFIFEKELEEKYGKKIDIELIQLREPPDMQGNLTGYLYAHKRIMEMLSEEKRNSFDTILYIHDAGLATRVFPLSYEAGDPSKATIRFPQGLAIEVLLSCIAKYIPLLKGLVLIMPSDQYFEYEDIDVKLVQKTITSSILSMICIPLLIDKTLGSLGVIELEDNGNIKKFYEKTKNRKIIPRFYSDFTLANTFQLFTTIENLNLLQKAVDHLMEHRKKRGKKLALDQHLIDDVDIDFNKLISEALTLDEEVLSEDQIVMKQFLDAHNVNLGAIVVKGFWEDWCSDISAYINIVKKIAKEKIKPDSDNNFFIRSQNINYAGKVKSCVFLDCDIVDLMGDYEDCLFVGCYKIRLMSGGPTENALFYTLKKSNFMRMNMSDYLFGQFKSGRRHVEVECPLNTSPTRLYHMMYKMMKDWESYTKSIKKGKGT